MATSTTTIATKSAAVDAAFRRGYARGQAGLERRLACLSKANNVLWLGLMTLDTTEPMNGIMLDKQTAESIKTVLLRSRIGQAKTLRRKLVAAIERERCDVAEQVERLAEVQS
ncbi:hypothetical protein LCGC14_2430510 [marine sediment metagenome]|uniref:Uncharacterized protein n=1 Tax=marine sediment metagenome TaxID=412755 RepID=A0A0F9EG06_9ZZZZ